MKCTMKLDQTMYKLTELIEEDIKEISNESQEVNVNPIMVNRVPIGEACSPYEVIRVQTENGLFPIVIIYDT